MESTSFTYPRETGSQLVFKLIESLIDSLRRSRKELVHTLKESYEVLTTTRPSSVGPLNVIRLVAEYLVSHGFDGLDKYLAELEKKYDESLWRLAEIASKRVQDEDILMVNSDSLAVRRMINLAVKEGKKIRIYVLESRPGMEGLRLAEYLDELGVKTYLIVDSAARFFMKDVDKVFVGAEGVAANGAVIAKVGTSQLALVAKEARVRFFVLAPLLKFSVETVYGELLPLPEGDWKLLMSDDERRNLPENYIARVPLYDVTPPEAVDAIICEAGLIAPQAIPFILREIHGSYPPKLRPVRELLEEIIKRWGE
mgnify:CR=1 FL=1